MSTIIHSRWAGTLLSSSHEEYLATADDTFVHRSGLHSDGVSLVASCVSSISPSSASGGTLPTLDPAEKIKALERLECQGLILVGGHDVTLQRETAFSKVSSKIHPLSLTLCQALENLEPQDKKQACARLMALSVFGPTHISSTMFTDLFMFVPPDWWARAFEMVCIRDDQDSLQSFLTYFFP